jgi:hypothetical protein
VGNTFKFISDDAMEITKLYHEINQDLKNTPDNHDRVIFEGLTFYQLNQNQLTQNYGVVNIPVRKGKQKIKVDFDGIKRFFTEVKPIFELKHQEFYKFFSTYKKNICSFEYDANTRVARISTDIPNVEYISTPDMNFLRNQKEALRNITSLGKNTDSESYLFVYEEYKKMCENKESCSTLYFDKIYKQATLTCNLGLCIRIAPKYFIGYDSKTEKCIISVSSLDNGVFVKIHTFNKLYDINQFCMVAPY